MVDDGVGLNCAIGRFEDERRGRGVGVRYLDVGGDQHEGGARASFEDATIDSRDVRRGDLDWCHGVDAHIGTAKNESFKGSPIRSIGDVCVVAHVGAER